MRTKHDLILALVYGFVICLTLVLFIESWLSVWLPVLWLIVLAAPIIEELAKNIPTLLRKERIISWAVFVALGFALAEWLFKNIIQYIETKTWYVSLAPLLHIVFVLPCAGLYVATRSRRWGLIGLMIAIILHGITNWAIIVAG